MGYCGFHFRMLFASIAILLLGLVSVNSFLLTTGTTTDIKLTPELTDAELIPELADAELVPESTDADLTLKVTDTQLIPEFQSLPDVPTESTFVLLPQEIAVSFGETFIVWVFAENVTDMYGWQVRLDFDPEFVECVNVSVPDSHVFSDRYPVSQAAIDWNSTEFTDRPIQFINNDEGYVLAGDCLLGQNQTTFNGSGFLVQIALKATSLGSSNLTLSSSETYYLNPRIEVTTPIVSNNIVIVIATEK